MPAASRCLRPCRERRQPARPDERVGVRVNLDVLNAQTQLFQTQRDLAKARYDVLVGSLRLRQASGQLAPTDVDAINRLLAK